MEHLHNLIIDSSLKAKPEFFTVANRKPEDIKYIVIHYFGSLGSAKAVANWFHKNANRVASAHYVVDEGNTVYQCVEDKDIAYAVGGKTYTHEKARNDNTISIEVRPSIIDKKYASDSSYAGWYFEKDVIKNVITLTVALLIKYNLDPSRVIRHYDVTGKLCPRPFVGNDINKKYQKTGNTLWSDFKDELREAYELERGKKMSLEQWKIDDIEKLYKAGVLSDKDGWLKRANEPIPAWAVFSLLNKVLELKK